MSKLFYSVNISLSSIEKFGYTCDSVIIVIKSFHFVPKLRHVEYRNILTIVQISAYISECKEDSCFRSFLVPINWIFPVASFQTHPFSLNYEVEV